jgi:hypothetical protein
MRAQPTLISRKMTFKLAADSAAQSLSLGLIAARQADLPACGKRTRAMR